MIYLPKSYYVDKSKLFLIPFFTFCLYEIYKMNGPFGPIAEEEGFYDNVLLQSVEDLEGWVIAWKVINLQ